MAIAKDDGKAIEARVHPTMIPRTSLLADVRGAFNAVHVQGDALGPTMYVGEGAGMMPTATSVVGDILEVAQARIRQGGGPPAPLGMPWRELRRARIRPIGMLESEYYLRFLVFDRPGVLGRIAGILGGSLSSIRPGSDDAARIKQILAEQGAWSQYLEVGIGPDAEIFTKTQPMASVGHGALIGLHPKSAWNNPEPEIVLAVNSRGRRTPRFDR